MHWRLRRLLGTCPRGPDPDPDEVWAWCEAAEQEIPLACGDLDNSCPILEPVRRHMAPDGGTPPPRHHAELVGTVFPRIKAAVRAADRALDHSSETPDIKTGAT